MEEEKKRERDCAILQTDRHCREGRTLPHVDPPATANSEKIAITKTIIQAKNEEYFS